MTELSKTETRPTAEPKADTVTNPAIATGNGAADDTATEPETLYCANHPNVETLLRCNRCGKPICLKCATLTDVGYRCNECIRGVQSAYFTAVPTDNVIAFVVAALVTAIAAPVVGALLRMFGFFGFLIAFMAGGGAGGLLAQIIRSSVGKRRGRHLRYFALGGVLTGVVIGSIVGLFFGIFPFNLPMLLFTILAAVTAYQILR